MPGFAFMVMPFGRKPTQAEPGKGPAEVDYDALWDKAYFPMLTALGYKPVRADEETGVLIIQQMIERLYFSDLVLVDLSSPNGNVYYEMGVRHAVCRKGCVLLASDWSRPLFDVAQMRLLRYPLPSGDLTDEMARAIQDTLTPGIAKMRNGLSPVYEILPGYPSSVNPSHATGIKDQIQALADFQGKLQGLRALSSSDRLRRIHDIKMEHHADLQLPGIAIGLLRALVDSVDKDQWQQVLDYIDGLDETVSNEAYVLEQRALALGKLRRPADAVVQLEALIARDGSTAEREGLLGGRYKELMRAAKAAGLDKDARRYRDLAIEHYERGMTIDLNDYFPASNLARLYRERKAPGDEARAQRALHITAAACERALKRGTSDEWVRCTMLGVQFDLPDADKAEALAYEVMREGSAAWKLDTTITSLEESLAHAQDSEIQARLQAVLASLHDLL